MNENKGLTSNLFVIVDLFLDPLLGQNKGYPTLDQTYKPLLNAMVLV